MQLEPLSAASEISPTVRLKTSTILSLARRKVIPSIRLGRKTVRFRLSEVIAALDKANTANSSRAEPCGPGKAHGGVNLASKTTWDKEVELS